MGIFDQLSSKKLDRDTFDSHGYKFDISLNTGCSQFVKEIWGVNDMTQGEVYRYRKATLRCVRYPDEGPMNGKLHTHLILNPGAHLLSEKVDLERIETESDLIQLEVHARCIVDERNKEYKNECIRCWERYKNNLQ